MRSALTALGISSLELQANKADPGPVEPGVRLGAMRRIKGLEFKAVAMVIDGRPDDRRRLERYVAATRARQWLLVVECGRNPQRVMVPLGIGGLFAKGVRSWL
ncbi:MAG TPA: ATP-binding domain-containing protein [Azospirillum sp.]